MRGRSATHGPSPALAALALLALLGLAACGHRHYDHDDGNVFLDNQTDASTFEDVLAFRLAAFGEPFTGNLLGAPLAPGSTEFVGVFHEDFYDAEADLELGDLVEWFDVFVGNGDDVFFEVF